MGTRVVEVLLRTNAGTFNSEMASAGASMRALEGHAAVGAGGAAKELTALDGAAHGVGGRIAQLGTSLRQLRCPLHRVAGQGSARPSKGPPRAGVTSVQDKMAAAGGILTAVVLSGAVAVGVESVRAYDAAEASRARLVTSMKNEGLSYQQNAASVSTFDAKMTQLGYTNATTENAISRNVVATKNLTTSEKEVSIAADIAAARHL